jgi:hypothetical protein
MSIVTANDNELLELQRTAGAALSQRRRGGVTSRRLAGEARGLVNMAQQVESGEAERSATPGAFAHLQSHADLGPSSILGGMSSSSSTPLTFASPDAAFRYRVSPTASALNSLAASWELSTAKFSVLLGFSQDSEWQEILSGKIQFNLSPDQRDRARTLFAIDQVLADLFRDKRATINWLHTAVREFGASPLARMQTGTMRGLYDVLDYLQGLTDEG